MGLRSGTTATLPVAVSLASSAALPEDYELAAEVGLAVADKREREHIRTHAEAVAKRLRWVASDRNVAVGKILEEIRGAATAVGVIFAPEADELAVLDAPA